MTDAPATGARRSVRWTLGVVVCLSAFAVDVSLPAVADTIRFFGAPDAKGQLIIAVYLAGYGALQIPVGLLADRFGRLPVFYVAMGLFIAASALTVFATSINQLLLARFLQGAAAASAPVLSRAIARDLTSGRELAEFTSYLVICLATTMLVAPIIGSLLILAFGWRAPYASSMLMGILVLILMRLFLHETSASSPSREGVGRQFLRSLRTFLASGVSVWATALIGFAFFGYMSIVAGLSQTLHDVYSMSAATVGFVFAGAVIFYLGSSQLSKHLLPRIGPAQQLKFSVACFLISSAIWVWLLIAGAPSFWMFFLSLIPFMMGMGPLFANATTLALEPLPNTAGFSAGIMGTTQLSLATAGAVVSGLIYDRSTDAMLAVLLTGAVLACLVYGLGRSYVRRLM
ncbi:MAG: MFS transporter [Pseudomonadota bacterium]